MEKFNRAERRNQRERIKEKRKSYWGRRRNELTPVQLGIIVNTPQVCSCMGCGNQRGFVGPTLKELAHIETLKEYTHAIGTTTGA